MSDPLDGYFADFDFNLELVEILTTPTRWQRFWRWLLRRPAVEVNTWIRR